jgi:hypothetical protein
MSKTPEHESTTIFRNFGKHQQRDTASHTFPTSSSIKSLTCSGRFDHKLRALFTSRRKEFGYVEKALGIDISFHRDPDGEPGRELIY